MEPKLNWSFKQLMVTYRIIEHVGNGFQCKIQKSGSLLGWQDMLDPFTGYRIWFSCPHDAEIWLLSRGVPADCITFREVLNAGS
jgi:hypothetical protein